LVGLIAAVVVAAKGKNAATVLTAGSLAMAVVGVAAIALGLVGMLGALPSAPGYEQGGPTGGVDAPGGANMTVALVVAGVVTLIVTAILASVFALIAHATGAASI